MKKIVYITGNWSKIMSAKHILEPLGIKVDHIKMETTEIQADTVEEIANLLNSTKDTIYDDLTSRLPKLDEKIAEDVKRKLLEHRYANLTQNTPKIEENPLILK